MPEVLKQHVIKTPAICGGRACVSGHRIRVADIVVWHERRGYSADEIAEFFPGLSLADIHAALAYYFDNRAEIESDLAADETLASQLAGQPSKFREKIGG